VRFEKQLPEGRYGTMEYCMKTMDSQTSIIHPKPIASLLSGFDSISTHILLIAFPLVLDLIIWLGPHLRIQLLIKAITERLTQTSGMGFTPSNETVQMSTEFWGFVAERFNLLTMLRSFPVGIPSLMSGRSPVGIPYGEPQFFEISSWINVLAIWVLFSLAGLFLGTFYYIVVSQASLNGKVDVIQAIGQWPGAFVQIVALALFWVVLFLAISIPVSCVISFFMLSGIPLGQIMLFFFFGFLLWLFFPLLFSAHGIVVYRLNVRASIIYSARITRQNMPATSLFFLMILVISQIMDIIWRWPKEDSWLTLVGLLGHAFVSTGLLAASFIFYRDANQWMQKTSIQAA
jgi:hypothetical protein